MLWVPHWHNHKELVLPANDASLFSNFSDISTGMLCLVSMVTVSPLAGL